MHTPPLVGLSEHVLVFFSHRYGGEHLEILEQFFAELPVLVDQATRHLRSNPNL